MYAGLLYPIYISTINNNPICELVIKSTIESINNHKISIDLLQNKLHSHNLSIQRIEPLFVSSYLANTLYDLQTTLPQIWKQNKNWYNIVYAGFTLYHLHLIGINPVDNKQILYNLNFINKNLISNLFNLTIQDIKQMPYDESLIYAYLYGCFNEVNQEVYTTLKDKKYIINFHRQKQMLGKFVYQEQIDKLALIKKSKDTQKVL